MNRLRRRAPDVRKKDADEAEDSLSEYSEGTVGTLSEEEEEEESELENDDEEDETEDKNEEEEEEDDDDDDEEEEEELGNSATEEDEVVGDSSKEAVVDTKKQNATNKSKRTTAPSTRGRPIRGRGGKLRSSSPPVFATRCREEGRLRTNRFKAADNAFEQRQKVRNEYRQRLADDPSFVPHIGSFWGHDDRFMPDGLRNRPRGRGFSRGRGQYSRAMPRGRGYPRSMASYPSRPRNSNVNNDDDNKRTVTAVTKEVNTPPVREQSNKVSAVPPTTTKESVKANPTPIKSNESESATKETDTAAPHTKAVSNNYSGNAGRQWGHDGFEELVRTEQQRERVTPTGYRGNSTGLYRATGRGRPFRGRGRGRGVSLHDNSSFGGFRGEGMEGRDHYVATLKPDQKTYKPRPAVETGTTTFNKQKADTTLSKDKTAVDVTETPSAPLPPSSSKGRQIRFGNIVNVTLSGTPSAATNNNSAAKFSTHPAVTPSQPKPKEKAVTNVAVVEEQAAVKEMATQTSTVTTIAANSPIAQPLGPTAETVANAGMAAAAANAAANAVQSTVTATKSTMTSMVNSAASTAAPTSAASTTSTGTNTTATATTTAPTTSPVVYLYTTANGLTIPITDGNPYQMMTSHGPPAIHPHHHHPHHPHHHQHPSQTHPHHAHHHRASSQVSVSHQPILVQTASGLVVPVTPVNATSGAGGTGAGAGSGATNTTGGNSSAGGYYGRPVVSQYSVPYSTGVDPNHPSPQSMPPTYIPYPGAMPLFMPPNSGGAPTGNAIYYNPMPYSPTAPAAVTTNSGNNANNSRKSYTDEDHIGEDPTVTMPSYYYHPGHGMHAPTSAAPATITMTASALSSSVSIPQQQRRTSASMSSMPSGVRISPSSSSSNQQ